MLTLPGDPQVAGPVARPLSRLEANAARAGRVLACSAAFVLGACAADPWRWDDRVLRRDAAPPAAAEVAPASVEPAARGLLVPVAGVARHQLVDTFDERRGLRRHNALDIMAPRGTRVLAATDGEVAKIYRHVLGGLSVYQYDMERQHSYYYAHLDGYAPGLREGAMLRRGDLVGFVGSTGNASKTAPHLHFAVLELGPEKKWWKGRPVNPIHLFR